MRRRNEEGFVIDGKHYTGYEATQRQRGLERTLRKQKRKILIDEKTGDKEKLAIDQTRYVVANDEYHRFSKAAGLRLQHERANVPGFGAKQHSAAENAAKEAKNKRDSMARLPKKQLENSKKSGIIEADNVNRIDLEEGKAVQRVISNVLKTDSGNIRLDGLPVEAQRSVLTATRKVLNKFPRLQGYTKGIIYDPDITAVADSQSLRGNIRLSSDFLDFEKLQRHRSYDVKLKAYPKGTEDIASIIVHEYGHQLDGWLTRRGAYGGNISEHGVIRTSEAVRKEVLRRVGLTDARRQEIRGEWAARGYSGKDLADAVKWECDQFITDNLSDYATYNHMEFFAECFTEYMMNPEPREMAREFGKLLEEIMGGLQ